MIVVALVAVGAVVLHLLGADGADVVGTLLFGVVFGVTLLIGRWPGFGAAALATALYAWLRRGAADDAGMLMFALVVAGRAASYVVTAYVTDVMRDRLPPISLAGAGGEGRGARASARRPPAAEADWSAPDDHGNMAAAWDPEPVVVPGDGWDDAPGPAVAGANGDNGFGHGDPYAPPGPAEQPLPAGWMQDDLPGDEIPVGYTGELFLHDLAGPVGGEPAGADGYAIGRDERVTGDVPMIDGMPFGQPVGPLSPPQPPEQVTAEYREPGVPGYPEPEYPQPDYPGPEYPQPDYPGPEYVQPEYPDPEYAQPEYPEAGYPQQTDHAEPEHSSAGYLPQDHPEPGYPQPEYPQSGYPQPEYPQSEYAETGYAGDGYGVDHPDPSGYPSEGAAAQTYEDPYADPRAYEEASWSDGQVEQWPPPAEGAVGDPVRPGDHWSGDAYPGDPGSGHQDAAAPAGGVGRTEVPHIDAETRLWTAGYFRDRLASAYDEARRTGVEFSVIMIQVPDTPFHTLSHRRQVALLRELGHQFIRAQVVDHLVHLPDGAQHWFAVVLAGTDKSAALGFEHRLRSAIAGYLRNRGLRLEDIQSATLTSPDDDEMMAAIWAGLLGEPEGQPASTW